MKTRTHTLFSKLLLTVAFLLIVLVSRANHLVGMDLLYTHVSGNTYKITLVAYGDCGSATSSSAFGVLPTNTPRIYIYNGNTRVDSITLSIQPPSAGVEITPVCPSFLALTQCTSLSFPTPGIKKFVYSANYTLPGTSPVWRFLFTGTLGGGTIAGRALSITNILSGTFTQLVDTLNNTVAPNSSATLTNVPTPFFCLPTANNYNPGAVDPNGDNLLFSLVPGANGSTTSIPGGLASYIFPYTGAAPLAVSSMTFDQTTGQIAFTPSALQRSLVVYNIREFRGGTFVGSCQREMTFLVQSCTNTPPNGNFSGASAGTIVDNTHFNICQNSGAFTLNIFPHQVVTTNDIYVSTSGLPAGLTFTTTGNGTPTPHCVISWTSTGPAPGSYTFYVTYLDNNCPLAGTQTIAYTITILPQATVTHSLLAAATCLDKAAISIIPGGGGGPWKVKVSRAVTPFDTIQSFTGVTTAFTDSLLPGSYILTIFTNGTGCKSSAPVVLTAPVFATPTVTFTHPSFCGGDDGSIRLSGLVPGTLDTIKYYFNGTLQLPQVHFVAPDGSVTLTGLIAGIYNAITVTYGRYCVSAPVGPYVLLNPPFPMRALGRINPSYCGFCNGSITIYGLRPGQVDTITYKKDGFPQTPIVQFIGSDSTVVISGLCPGVYSEFIARTAGVCVSNMLGPITLAPPPFTARAVSHTNPAYCGICNGTMTIYGLHPFQTDTITYLKDGIAQPPVVRTIGPDSTVIITGLCPGVYSNIVARTGGVCVSNILGPVTLTVPPFTMRALTFTNPPYCGICTGTITLYGLYPGQTDTITYTRGGVAQPPLVFTVGPDSTVTLTGLCAGLYDNFVARTGGICISNTLGPANLTVPPFTMRATDFSNPTYCGLCDGVIRLYGLYPGQTDTVTYTRYGVPQPPHIQLVGADSIITITGLCDGVYDNFVARTGGVCVSNTLGPVTLIVPPFTVRSLSFTNPPYCGICTGTITLHGVHPGLTDTVTYIKDGVAQPPHIQFVGADSTITITGLCAGLYDDFVVRTGGICVSDTLGPAHLTVPPFTMRALSFTNPPYCGICTGTITLYGLYPGQIDSIYYTLNGVAQTPVVQTVAADSTIVVTGLCAGLYDNFVARTGGVCVSNMLGPANLTVPPFTMRALSFTNPPYCGICTGTITLYGLYPGQTDSIYYTLNGVAQPPLVQTVAADSTIVFTGLCAGLYDNFVARTGGVCVSNMLGPANLTVPPFTMRALSFTNPPYCGICTGTITLYGLYPGQTDSIYYTLNGVAQTPLVQTVAADSTIVFNGLCAGLYDNFVARTGGVCVSNMLGPANLTVPPFTMRAISATNATKCGWCDGSIRLYGLYPGQVDTITYLRDGVPQMPISAIIGADSMVVITGLCAGVYSNFVARTGGVCVSNTLGPVTLVDPPIFPGFNFVVKETCKVDTVLFANTSAPAADLTYTWSFGDGDSSVATNPTHLYYLPGNYKATLIITNTRCVDSVTKTIPILNILKAGFTQAPDSFVCSGTPVTYTNTSLGFNLRYAWSFGDGSKDSTIDPVHIFGRTGTYKVVMALSNNGPCRDTARSVITVDSISDISIKLTDSVLCDGHTVTFSGIYAGVGCTGTLWTFTDGTKIANENPITRAFDANGTLSVRFDAFYRACPDTSASRNLWVFSHPQVYVGPDQAICPGGNPITLTDETYAGVPGLRWLWSTGERTSSIKIASPGSYYVKMIVDGCTATDTVVVKQDCFMDVPNAFSPNGDGINDYFLPRPLLAKGLATFKMSIFNRWGQTIFETDHTEGRGWDGRLNGTEQPEGVYIYLIDATFIDGQQEKHQGNLTLLR